MKKLKKFLSSSKINVVVFVPATVLILLASFVAASAAISYFSSGATMYDIGVTLMENGQAVSWRNYNNDGSWDESNGILLEGMIAEGEQLILGKTYKEELSVCNSGSINQYVRVSIYKYWTDKDGKKLQNLNPDYIELNFCNLGSAWQVDTGSSTQERTVLYYNNLLNSGDDTPLFTDELTINRAVADVVENGVYSYDGAKFCIEIHVDAVQEHNAEDAWGSNAVISADAGTLSLN